MDTGNDSWSHPSVKNYRSSTTAKRKEKFLSCTDELLSIWMSELEWSVLDIQATLSGFSSLYIHIAIIIKESMSSWEEFGMERMEWK